MSLCILLLTITSAFANLYNPGLVNYVSFPSNYSFIGSASMYPIPSFYNQEEFIEYVVGVLLYDNTLDLLYAVSRTQTTIQLSVSSTNTNGSVTTPSTFTVLSQQTAFMDITAVNSFPGTIFIALTNCENTTILVCTRTGEILQQFVVLGAHAIGISGILWSA